MRKKGHLETLSMVMLDFDYDGEVFDLDAVFYADAIGESELGVVISRRANGQESHGGIH